MIEEFSSIDLVLIIIFNTSGKAPIQRMHAMNTVYMSTVCVQLKSISASNLLLLAVSSVHG